MTFDEVIKFDEAIRSLRPNSIGKYDTSNGVIIGWYDTNNTQPSAEEITAELTRLEGIFDSFDYARKRQNEYPDFRDYLDGVVKSDQDQIDKYIADCLAVKAKYPKG